MFHFLSPYFEPTFSLHATSPSAAEITQLFIWINIVCAFIFLVVVVWVGYSVFKFRYKGEEGEPDQHQIPKIYEITWTVIPALICVLFGYWTVVSMLGPRSGEATPEEEKNPDVIVTGVQWWWDIRYPKLGVVTANELHVPVGKPLVVDLQSVDVIHTFWIYVLGRKEQMIPGPPPLHQDRAGQGGRVRRRLRPVLRQPARLDAPPDGRPEPGRFRRLGRRADEGACRSPIRGCCSRFYRPRKGLREGLYARSPPC